MKSCSDHYPLLLSLSRETRSYASSFKIMSMWNSHSDSKRLVKEVWCTDVQGCPMSRLSQKLKLMKKELKIWNKTVLEMSISRFRKLRILWTLFKPNLPLMAFLTPCMNKRLLHSFLYNKLFYFKMNFGRIRPECLGLCKETEILLISIKLPNSSRFLDNCPLLELGILLLMIGL